MRQFDTCSESLRSTAPFPCRGEVFLRLSKPRVRSGLALQWCEVKIEVMLDLTCFQVEQALTRRARARLATVTTHISAGGVVLAILPFVMIALRLSGACEGSRARGAVSGVRASATVAVLSFYDGVAVWWSVTRERARVRRAVAVGRGVLSTVACERVRA